MATKKTLFNNTLKAGALQYTIFIAVVIALLIFAFISLTYLQQHFKNKASLYKQVIHNTNLAINYMATKKTTYNQPVEIQFTENPTEHTFIEKKHWGVFDLVTTTSTIQKETFTKNAFLGGYLQERPSLYVQDNNQPLVVVGNTKIEGITYLPKQGVKRGTIAGNSYTGTQLIYGSIQLSKPKLPALKNNDYLKRLSQGTLQISNSVSLELNENIELQNSFNKPTQYFYSNSTISLRDVKLSGNIIIQSSTLIKVYPSALLADIIIVAPKIQILENVTGNFQAFASKEILIAKNCTLHFPSSILIYEKKKSTSIHRPEPTTEIDHIEIQTGTNIDGVVGFLSDNKTNTFKPQILQESNTTIKGEVYCNGNFELKGTVIGSVFTKGFISNQFGSIYQNHVYNGNILTTNFPEKYSGFLIEKSTKNVVKWLYY